MRSTPYILFIAPAAPPRKSAESIQVGRILTALDACARGKLITIAPDASGWSASDESLALTLKHFERQELKLPCHVFLSRLLGSHRLARLQVPDAQFWITAMDGQVLRALAQKPDVIYSRSSPMSAALLARKLKRQLQVPWIMHLSDPWADSPYKAPNARNVQDEAACFADADMITLTTQGQAAFYQKKYPHWAAKISVSPNMMPVEASPPIPSNDATLRLVYTGNFYGDRSPKPLVDALAIVQAKQPELMHKIHVNVYGQAQGHCLEQLKRMPEVITYHGPVSFEEAARAQAMADIVLSIEPELDHPLGASFLPSKVLDCLGMGKPLLALTPAGSETAAICNEGYGWAIAPSQPETIAARLMELIETLPGLRQTSPKAPPERYRPSVVAAALLAQIDRLRSST